jgi:hypothetical protein
MNGDIELFYYLLYVVLLVMLRGTRLDFCADAEGARPDLVIPHRSLRSLFSAFQA